MSTRVGENEVIGKSGKKGKRSKKKEMDGLEEMEDCVDVERDGLEKIGKKGKKSKNKEMDGLEEMNDCEDVEDGREKIGKKGKKSKKKEMDGLEEMNDCADVEEDGLEKIGKKGKKSKKKEMDALEEMNDCADVEEDGLEEIGKKGKKSKKKQMDDCTNVELEQNLESRVERKQKKNKGNDMVSGEESVNGESFGKFDTDNQPEKVKKKKKKDKRLSVPGEVSDCLDTKETSSLSLKKREKKLKNADEHEVTIDPSLNVTQDEDDTVDKWKKKKTKRKYSETSESRDALNEMTETEAKENSNVVGDVEKKKKKKRIMMVEKEDDNDRVKKNSAGEDVENSLVDDGMVAMEKVKTKRMKRKNEEIADKDGLSNKVQDNKGTNVSRKKIKSVENDLKKPTSKEQKKVRFSEHNQVFGNEENSEGHLVRGKRFTPEEDAILRAAVEKYIESHCLGEKGLEMVMNCNSRYHRQVKYCWREIGAALPHRPTNSISYRAHVLFEGGKRLNWTEEERQMLLEQYEIHGSNWKLMAKEFKRHRLFLKDTWRRIKMKRNRGHWSQEEYQNLFDYVNADLRAKANEEKKSKHGMLRDNICFTAISDKLRTRSDSSCCTKWYGQLTPAMVNEGIWAYSDDYRLLDALSNLDACCIEDVDWDDLIDHRSGDVCRKRWDQMVLHIGFHGVKSFAEQVEVLAKRYCPELLEAREAWDSKPRVP